MQALTRSNALLASLLLLTVGLSATLPTTVADHNDVGLRLVVGDPDPTPTPEPDVGPALTPLYHGDEEAEELAFRGTRERISPLDQTGLGYGADGWIGYLDAVVEVPGATVTRCAVLLEELCRQQEDPLYRANPTQGDEQCENLEQRLDPEACTGQGHPWQLDIFPGVRLQQDALDVTGSPGSGFLFPGLYGLYAYVFGQGSGPAAGEGAFSHLDPDLCLDHSGLATCKLITPSDLKDHLDRSSAVGQTQAPAICFFAPQFAVLAPGEPSGPCAANSVFDQYIPPSDSALYASNKPGWYAQTAFLDPTASLQPAAALPMLEGPREDVARIIHTYVNPVPTPPAAWCVAPPIATTADDGLSTDGLLIDGLGIDYLVEAHDLDVYTSPVPRAPVPVDGAIDDLVRAISTASPDPILDTLTQVPGGDVAGNLLDETDELVSRAGPLQAPAAEPDAHGLDDTLALTGSQETPLCDQAQGLTSGTGTGTAYNVVDARMVQRAAQGLVAFATVHSTDTQLLWEHGPAPQPDLGAGSHPFKDPTFTDASGLPAHDQDQDTGAWHTSAWSFMGDLGVFLDLDGDQAFSGCPDPGLAPSEAQPDVCAARLAWDAYNPSACADPGCGQTWGQAAQAQGYTDPLGLYAVLEITGPVVLQHQHSLETWVLGLQDVEATNCVVLESLGLMDLDTPQGDRLRALHGLAASAPAEAFLEPLCQGTDGQRLLVRDGFANQQDGGRFNALFTWSRVTPEANAAPVAPDDRLTLTAVLTTERVTEDTQDTIALGAAGTTATLAHTWEDGDRTYLWQDVDLFRTHER